ncbi:D-alanyl-D-alanine carboxypeptidase family protein [Alkalibaculum bacchi]|uniref:D-alanyl-D-alanine carboxypeptidase family protein n=1 Tax=Alkalibaculum bacchi TaxID=645887 RepID=UPI0026ECBD00|nr:D-alanyl-D-alanine carboxypeptidase family protein [Alkalibaculum bacchi]
MEKKIVTLLLILIITIQPITHANTDPNILSPAAILMDAETGQVLYDKSAKERLYPASITKVLTAIIALEKNENLNEKVIIGKDVPYQIASNSSAIYLLPGEVVTLEQLMYALMVESANDAAVAIAEHTAGSVENFAKLMNDKAKELGATDSHFINPHGLHSEDHYTTAYDMALIMKEAIKNPVLRKLMTTSNYIIPETNEQQTRYLWTKNRLYKSEGDEFYNDKVIASKTGFTTEAKNTLISAAENNGMSLIAVVLNGQSASTYYDTSALFDYGFTSFETSTLIRKDDFVKEQGIEKGSKPLQIVSRSTIKYVKTKNNSDNINETIKISQNLPSTISKGDVIGTIEYSVGNEKVGEAQLVAGNEVLSSSAIRIQKLKDSLIYLIPTLLLLYIFARIYVYIRNTQIRKRRIRKKYGITYGSVPRRRRSRRSQYYRY